MDVIPASRADAWACSTRPPRRALDAPGRRPEPPPAALEVVTGNLRTRLRAICRPAVLPQGLRMLRAVSREQPRHAPPTPLTGPIGPGRRLLVLRQLVLRQLEDLRARAPRPDARSTTCCSPPSPTGLRAMLRGSKEGAPTARCCKRRCRSGQDPATWRDDRGPAASGHLQSRPAAAGHQRRTARRKQHPGEGTASIVAMPASLARLGVAWARYAAGAERFDELRQPPPGPRDLGAVERPVADVVGVGQDWDMRRWQPVPAG